MPEKTKIHLKNGGGGSFDRSNTGNSNGRQQKIRPVRAESMTKGAAGSRQRAAHTDSFERYPPRAELGGGGGGGRGVVKSKAATGKSRLSNAGSRYLIHFYVANFCKLTLSLVRCSGFHTHFLVICSRGSAASSINPYESVPGGGGGRTASSVISSEVRGDGSRDSRNRQRRPNNDISGEARKAAYARSRSMGAVEAAERGMGSRERNRNRYGVWMNISTF